MGLELDRSDFATTANTSKTSLGGLVMRISSAYASINMAASMFLDSYGPRGSSVFSKGPVPEYFERPSRATTTTSPGHELRRAPFDGGIVLGEFPRFS